MPDDKAKAAALRWTEFFMASTVATNPQSIKAGIESITTAIGMVLIGAALLVLVWLVCLVT